MTDDLIPFRPRRTLSRYVDDKAVKDFARVAESKRLFPDHAADRVTELIDNPNQTEETIEELARLLGQSE